MAAGGLTTVAGTVGSTLTGFVEDVTATPTAAPTSSVVSGSPLIASPTEPYTNRDSVDLMVTVPKEVVGDPEYTLRVYLALEGLEAAPIAQQALSTVPLTIIPVELTEGINDFTVTLIGPAGESEPSPIVRYVLDKKEPGILLASPRDGATVNRAVVELEGRSQARSTLVARNTTTGDSIGGAADGDGRFRLDLPIDMGRNKIVIGSTDPAGNTNELELTVTRGSGKLRASLSASDYEIKRSALPEPISLTVTVDDPDGKPLEGARVTFSLSIPGIKSVTYDTTTDPNGHAVFSTSIPDGADPGGGSAAVLVRTNRFGNASDETVITIKK